MKTNSYKQKKDLGAGQDDTENETPKNQIWVKLPGISFAIKTNANQMIMLTVILCVFILAFILLVKKF